jgi:hypothetical protein
MHVWIIVVFLQKNRGAPFLCACEEQRGTPAGAARRKFQNRGNNSDHQAQACDFFSLLLAQHAHTRFHGGLLLFAVFIGRNVIVYNSGGGTQKNKKHLSTFFFLASLAKKNAYETHILSIAAATITVAAAVAAVVACGVR